MNRKDRNSILIFATIIILGFAGIWLTYYFSMKKANEDGLKRQCLRNIDQEFKGRLTEVERFEYDDFMHNRFFNLHIKLDDTKNEFIDYHYNITPKSKKLLDFAAKGQTVTKEKGKNTFTIVDLTGKRKEFKIAKCD